MVDVYVIGDGIPELAAALELAEVGLTVRVARGGSAPAAEGAGTPVGALAPFDPDRVTDPDGTLREFLTHVAAPLSAGGPATPGAASRAAAPESVLLRGAKSDPVEQPMPSVFGIPAVPLSEASLAVLGGAGATRAFLDRVMPLLTIGKTQRLGKLVRARIGATALQRLVEPLVREKYGVSADDVDVAIAAPGLNEDVTTAGSLCGAAMEYAARSVARETFVQPVDGWEQLRETLLDRLALYGAEIVDAGVVTVAEVTFDATESSQPAAADETTWQVVERGDTAGEASITARAVVVGESAAGTELPLQGAAETSRARWVVIAEVSAPEWVGAATNPTSAKDLVEVVRDDSGSFWAVRWQAPTVHSVDDAAQSSSWTIRASSSIGLAPDLESDQVAAAALGAAGAARVPGGRLHAFSVLAPFATKSARDRALAHTMSSREAKSTCLSVGTHAHSGDLATAVHDAREAAVRLRRHLTGIAE
ncbi:hypothetical protein [Leucobacter japonicus]|uniref:hypothetical protein n=1 Tax=Leucobacter japonicus TaxID=1461259 RepID=UPI0006A7EE3C|nr:hypothetical protein [Leucobacter japonicus]